MNLASKTKLCRDVNCKRAGKRLRRDKFPRNNLNKDRLHSYCRECTQRRTNETRVRIRPAKQAQRRVEAQRKPMVIAATIQDTIVKGARTREQIEAVTNLPMDDICDVLAVLAFEDRSIRVERVRGEARFYPVRAA